MRITGLSIYSAELEYRGEVYAFAGGRSYRSFTSTILVLHTDAGLEGYGEVCPCGPAYMPAFAGGLKSCLEALVPCVLGEDPRQVARLVAKMSQALSGHAYAKAAIDLACWDLLGKASRRVSLSPLKMPGVAVSPQPPMPILSSVRLLTAC